MLVDRDEMNDMKRINLDESFWSERYTSGETGWDIGYVSPPLKEYIDQLTNKDLKILIPGGGNSYEAEYLFKDGFSNVSVVDISTVPLENFLKRVPSFPKENLLHQDFYDLKETYDLILEQTFFCTQHLKFRDKYVSKIHELLKSNGKLVGLLFNIPLNDHKPPFGGSKKEYRSLFIKSFKIEKMEVSYNSIPQRQGNELFINMSKREKEMQTT